MNANAVGASGNSRAELMGSFPGLGASIAGTQVKGNLVNARRRYVLEKYGEAAVRSVALSLSPAARASFESTQLAFAWVPYAPMVEIDCAIIAGPMQGVASRMKAFGSEICTYDLPVLYYAVLKIGTPRFVITHLASIYARYFRHGRGTIETTVGDMQAGFTLVDAVHPLYMCTFGMAGWVRRCVELSGGQNVASLHTECVHRGDGRCAWHLTWR
jgi:hypothetical protein